MVEFTTVIQQFDQQGEKTGWTYIEIPADIAQALLPGNKKSFRVKGLLDKFSFEGITLLPMGGGNFIMPLNAFLRKNIHKGKGAMLHVQVIADFNTPGIPDWLTECLSDEPGALAYFNELPRYHQNYFIKWLESAKTETTRTRRIAKVIDACIRKLDFGSMMRLDRESRQFK